MNRNKVTLREAMAAVLGAVAMFSVIFLAQIIDANDKEFEAQQLRADAVRGGFYEGMSRIMCVGGLRYDRTAGKYIDAQKVGPAK
jgi:hypothetical protein